MQAVTRANKYFKDRRSKEPADTEEDVSLVSECSMFVNIVAGSRIQGEICHNKPYIVSNIVHKFHL